VNKGVVTAKIIKVFIITHFGKSQKLENSGICAELFLKNQAKQVCKETH
jgi:hypothetical protein